MNTPLSSDLLRNKITATSMVDNAIQSLFTDGTTVIPESAVDTLRARLRAEHDWAAEALIITYDGNASATVSINRIEDYLAIAKDGVEASSQRCSGRSTRIANTTIMELLHNGRCLVTDHHPGQTATRFLFRRIMRRLQLEHSDIYEHVRPDVAGDTPFVIELAGHPSFTANTEE